MSSTTEPSRRPGLSGPSGPLVDLKVLELGSLIAGPFCGRLLADFGASVIKIEPAKGDALREWSLVTDHGSLWSMVQSRNKKSVTADLRTPAGQELARALAADCDVVIENFRPGRMEEWGLGYDDLQAINPGIIMVRISGFGQTGPYRLRPGFGNIAEAMGGIRFVTGWPDRFPVRVGLSLADSVSALYATIGLLMAVHERTLSGRGQVVDVALTEATFSLLEAILPEYGFDGRVRGRTGNTLNGAAPSNVYATADGKYVAVGANSESIFRRLAKAMEQPALADDPRFATNQARRENVGELDELIGQWVGGRSLADVQTALGDCDVPAGPIYSIADIVEDMQYQARDMVVEVDDPRVGRILMPGIVPRLERTPGSIRWAGPELGQDNDEIRRQAARTMAKEESLP